MRLGRTVVATAVASAMGGCGGGGGGDSGPIRVPFTSFENVRGNQIVVMEGSSTTASGTQTIAPDGDVTITSIQSASTGRDEVFLTYDGSRALKGITVGSGVSFERDTPGHSIVCSGGLCVASNPSASAIAVDAFAVGWNYQTYGVWTRDLSSTSWMAGATSAGSATPATGIPTINSATFNGSAGGLYVDTSGTPFLTTASMTANVNFGTRIIGFSTTGTTLTNANTGIQTSDAGLNMSGNLSYNPGVNAFSGAVNTANLQMNGGVSGRFYGPNAEEIGGTYDLQNAVGGPPVNRMIGAFGGKR